MKPNPLGVATKTRRQRKGFLLKQRHRKGQVMVLGCVTMLLLATSLMMSFSIANVVHERIRIQSHADAMAFSLAVLEARTMNYIAYSNRAIAAAFVSMTSVHAYVAIADSAIPLLEAGRIAMVISAAAEFALCIATENPKHCADGARILARQVSNYSRAIQRYQRNLRNSSLDRNLNDAVKAFVKLADDIHNSQRNAVSTTKLHIQTGWVLNEMGQINAPCASNQIPLIGYINTREFDCALELDDPSGGNCPRKSSLDNRRRIMSNVVDASRPVFLRDSHTVTIITPPFFQQSFLQELMSRSPNPTIPGAGLNYRVDGWLTDSICQKPSNNSSFKGSASCASAGGAVMSFLLVIDLPGAWPASKATVGSNSSGGKHSDTTHSSGARHSEYKGLFSGNSDLSGSCTSKGNCFVNFRLDTKERGWGQPAVYSRVSQALRASTRTGNACEESKRPWELNDSRTTTIDHGQRPQGRLSYAPSRDGTAVSKALVYFHRMDNWKFPPNLFDPYWRAKLHPFAREEMAGVLLMHEDTLLALSSDIVPIDGKFRPRRNK